MLIRRGFEQLSSYSGWRVITKKPRANLLARADVKGLKIKYPNYRHNFGRTKLVSMF